MFLIQQTRIPSEKLTQTILKVIEIHEFFLYLCSWYESFSADVE
jgi:hypothetical protein